MKAENVSILKKEGIGVLPTDTLYGVVGSAFSRKAVERIYALKGRDQNKPFIILLPSVASLKKFGVSLTPQHKKFLSIVWPGPVSIILPCKAKEFEYLHRGTKSLAFRVPKNKKLIALLKKTGPLVAPSANPQGKKPAHTIAEAKEYFGESVDFYVAGGTKKGNPSKLISLLQEKPEIIRP